MGVGLAVVAGVGAVAAGAAAYSSSQEKAGAVKNANAQQGYQFGQTKNASKWQDKNNANIYEHLRSLPDYEKLTLGDSSAGLKAYLSQGKYLPILQKFAGTLNSNYQQQIESVAPGFLEAFKTTGKNVNDWAHGQIGADVAAQTQRGAAQAALSGGYSAGSGMFQNRVARDFGLTSLDLQQKAASLIPSIASTAAGLNPVNSANLLLSPEYFQARADSATATNWGVDNFNKDREFQRTMPAPPSYAKGLFAPPQAQYNGPSPWASAGMAAGSSLASSYSGGYFSGMGGGTGGGANMGAGRGGANLPAGA